MAYSRKGYHPLSYRNSNQSNKTDVVFLCTRMASYIGAPSPIPAFSVVTIRHVTCKRQARGILLQASPSRYGMMIEKMESAV